MTDAGPHRRTDPAEPVAADSAAWLKVTLASIGDGVITTDTQGRVTFLNSVAETLTGWTQGQAAGQLLTEVFHIVNQDTRAEVENPALRALREGIIVGLANHTILIARDGTERNIDDSAAPIRNGGGTVAGSVLVFRDITERYRQELLVRQEREYAQNILATLRHPFLVLDRDMRVVSANRSFYECFAVRPEQTEGRLLFELGNRQWDIPRLRELLEQILPANDHTVEDFEVEHEFEGLGRRVMTLNARRVRKPGNHSQLVLLVIEDITVRRDAEQALRDSEVRYRRLFQSAKDGILILDADTGRITDANAFMAGLVGLDASELLGKELHEIGLFADIDASKKAFRTLQEKGYVRYEHLPVQNRRGGTVEVEVVANVYHEDHNLVAQCNIRDISQRVRMEKKILEQAEQLSAESRRKDEFLAMLSHELRNPLAPIRSAVHILKLHEAQGADPLQKQAREIIERQTSNLTKIVGDLLEVSRVMSGRIRLEATPVDLNEIIRHAAETVKPLISQRGHILSLRPHDGGLWVSGDATRLEQVLVNLVTNAAKYTPDGGKIEVTCERRSDRGIELAQVRVRDNGEGIPADLLPRLFDLFSQADHSLARSAGGLGIGLALAHRLVELHGGTIHAASDGPGKGSEFTLTLPAMAVHAAAGPMKDAGAASAHPGGVRVLVVDDNIDHVSMLAARLRHAGYLVNTAYNGLDGLAIAQAWNPDIVLLDIGLPGLSGYEVARRLRAESSLGIGGSRIRLIGLTGYGREEDKELARQAGFDAHLVKPVEFEDVEQAMLADRVRS
ncbi:MAG: PAS domain S-box protein [Planctomycetes bacterium]|nr:PAS domain S-box protein [Planctomycetota bacterium]